MFFFDSFFDLSEVLNVKKDLKAVISIFHVFFSIKNEEQFFESPQKPAKRRSLTFILP
jgi:hypothetical protein